ncbi:MAG: CPBP family intramembrane metalloprotease [Candidatus Cohnella colombiensis]|uniref:CPBP family intramembrane metalloprotease n=1 Tax=Candidatus Cohnella colombiensis TaxID=3121368 RepID=A0AA95JBT4_9BACL|nr:MAG: CPBP family intramembrane metalloprotease [Cohnella sp.]
MKRYASMLGNTLLYVTMIVIAILLYNTVVNALLAWGTFGNGEQLPAQVFIVLILAIGLSWVAYTIKYRIRANAPSGGFIGMQQFTTLAWSRTAQLMLVGVAFALFYTAMMKLLLHHGVTDLSHFTEQYADVAVYYLIASAVINTALELILFIGILFNEVRRGIPTLWAVLIVSIIMAILQPGGPAMQLIGVGLGFLYGYTYIRTNSIWSVILIGCTFNVVFFTLVKTSAFDWIGSLNDVVLVLMIVVTAVYMAATLISRRVTLNKYGREG